MKTTMKALAVVQRASCFLLLFASIPAVGQTWTWSQKADMPGARANARTAVVGNKLYAVGGWVFGEPRGSRGSRELDTPVNTVSVYDPQKDTWKSLAPLPVAGSVGVATIGDTLYAVAGGAKAIFAYDSARDRWAAKHPLPVKLDNFATVALNQRLYTVGGVPDDTPEDNMRRGIVLEYEPASDTWARRADLPTHRHAVSAVTFKGRLYAMGGVAGGTGDTTTVDEYDPAHDRWTAKQPLPHGIAYASTLVSGGRIYVFGATRVGGVRSNTRVQVYDPAADTWKVLPDAAPALMGNTVVELNGNAYSIGGWMFREGVLPRTLQCVLP